MAGRGTVEAQDQAAHSRVLMLDKAEQWVPAVDPMHFDKPAAGVGLGKTFGTLVAESEPGITVGLIPCAVGGSPISVWEPGVFYNGTKCYPWDDALRRARTALKSGVLKGILWHQGESDCKPKEAALYEQKLKGMVERWRTELQAAELPFILGQMGRFPEAPWSAAAEQVDAVHQALPKLLPRVAFVSATGLGHRGDKLHFDSAACRELGQRYYAAYRSLVPAP
jgi:hypothetical protein